MVSDPVTAHEIVRLPGLAEDKEEWFACRNKDCGLSIYGQAIQGLKELELASLEHWCPAPFSDALPVTHVSYSSYEVFYIRGKNAVST